jgi:hypothetical protein
MPKLHISRVPANALISVARMDAISLPRVCYPAYIVIHITGRAKIIVSFSQPLSRAPFNTTLSGNKASSSGTSYSAGDGRIQIYGSLRK